MSNFQRKTKATVLYGMNSEQAELQHRLHSVIHTNQDFPASSVIKVITALHLQPVMAPSVVYGRDNELRVFSSMQSIIPSTHINGSECHAGMQISIDHPWLSASADGIITCACHRRCVLEIKCPFTAQNLLWQDIISDPKHYMFGGHLQRGHRYFLQVQLQMFVYNVNMCEFVVLVGDGLVHEKIVRDDIYIADVLPTLYRFWARHVVPELLTRAVEKTPANITTPEKLYCYCHQPEKGKMVGCDGKDCPYKWVHLPCILPKRKTLPKGKWYCKDCVKQK